MSSGYYNQDNDDNRSYQKTVAMCVAAASLVILLFLVILYVNSDSSSSKTAKTSVEETTKEEDEFLKDSHNITSDELEFWNDQPKKKNNKAVEEEKEGELTPYKGPDADNDSDTDTNTNASKDNDNKDTDKKETDKSSTTQKNKRDDSEEGEGSLNRDSDEKYENGDYIAVTDDKGKKKYYEILKDVAKNDYDFENNLLNENGNITYQNGKREAIKGVDLSKYNGTVDFAKLKDNGIGFVMLRLGSRGYGTGKITLDEKFVEYAQNAQLAGLQIGAYFYSQAINENEAVEEANYIIGAISGFNVKYPVAIDIEKVEGDEARTDKLTNKERTAVVKSFCDTVKGYGYKPVIYATREMLIAGLDLEELADYDVWLSDDTIPTDYPYRFSMWQYNKKGRLDGITGDIDLDISFIDYEQK